MKRVLVLLLAAFVAGTPFTPACVPATAHWIQPEPIPFYVKSPLLSEAEIQEARAAKPSANFPAKIAISLVERETISRFIGPYYNSVVPGIEMDVGMTAAKEMVDRIHAQLKATGVAQEIRLLERKRYFFSPFLAPYSTLPEVRPSVKQLRLEAARGQSQILITLQSLGREIFSSDALIYQYDIEVGIWDVGSGYLYGTAQGSGLKRTFIDFGLDNYAMAQRSAIDELGKEIRKEFDQIKECYVRGKPDQEANCHPGNQ